MRYGSLFSGAGLGDFGFEMAGFEVAWQVENNEYCQKILDLRWPNVKKYKNIKEINPEQLERVDLITGGFPCQPFSNAGKRNGENDNRNLWPEMLRIIRSVKPKFVVAENVFGIIDLYLDRVLADLENEGYTCWPFVFSTASFGGPIPRQRLWIVAISNSSGLLCGEIGKYADENRHNALCNTGENSIGLEGMFWPNSEYRKCPDGRKRMFKPGIVGVVDGDSNTMDRLKALGNGQTPCSTYAIGKIISELSAERE